MKQRIIGALLLAFMTFATVNTTSAAAWHHHHERHHHHHGHMHR